MANILTGRIISISPTETINTKSGKQFLKRELVIDCTRFDPYTGERGFDNTPCITFIQDKCALLDSYQSGMVVTVSIDINGRRSDDGRYYNDIRGYKVELKSLPQQPQVTAPTPAPTQPVYQPQQPTYPQQPQWQQAPNQGYRPNDMPF